MRKLFSALLLIALGTVGLLSYQYLFGARGASFPPGLTPIEKAALKAERIQADELQQTIDALRRNDGSRVIWGDRFLRWTVLAYTLWRLDRGDTGIIGIMEDLMVSYYEHAWYPNVGKAPSMPFPGLIQYFRADGTWEDYWNDYKPVYASAFLLEFYLLSSYDRAWGITNYRMLRNVADSILSMWLPGRHQPTGYVDASDVGGVYFVEVKNITSSVDSAMVYSSLVASAVIAKELANDVERHDRYVMYANDMRDHFYDQVWDWFPTATFGANAGEAYGTAIQIGMTLPYFDGDEKIDALRDYLVSNLRVDEQSWLLKWRPQDASVSSRSMLAAIGLAPRYSSLAYKILDAYAQAALSNDPWLLTKSDGYEAEDPVWLSGKYLLTYVFTKDRMLTGRIPFSPRLMTGDLSFETSVAVELRDVVTARATIPTLSRMIDVSANRTERGLRYTMAGIDDQNVTVTFQLADRATVSSDAKRWGLIESSFTSDVTVWVVPSGRVEITIDFG